MNLLTQTQNNLTNSNRFLIPVFMILVLVLATCSSKKPETLVTTLENNQENVQDNQILQLVEDEQETLTEEEQQALTTPINEPIIPDTSGNYANSELFLEDQDSLDIPADILAQIKRNLLAEKYPTVLELVDGRTDDASTYYRGIAYFVMMQEQHKYSGSERVEFAKQAEDTLLDVASSTSYPGLKARAELWYAVTLQSQYTDYRTLKTAVNTLHMVSQNRNARVYNDSIYYLGNVHAKMGWYGPARNYYKKVNGLNQNGDDRIYDYMDKANYSTFEASEAGLERLRSYMDGTHKDYK